MADVDASAMPLLELRGIAKRYGGVRALEGVDFACRPGSIHAVLGENGAGKSTLIKIISGVVQPDEGEILLAGDAVRFSGPSDANRAGIVAIFQELSLVPDLSVADNICLSNPPRRFGLIDGRAQRRRAAELLDRLGCRDLEPRARVKDLPLSRRQLVEIAKALALQPRLLVLDEATSALTAADVEHVFQLLRELRGEGLALLYISHRMHEIAALADTCSVFRNGHHVETFPHGTRTDQQIVRLMIGRDITQIYPPKPVPRVPAASCLEVSCLSWGDRLAELTFAVGKGEIVGLGGLDGQGQPELMLALFGVLRGVEGTVRVDGEPYAASSPAHAKAPACGMALVPEDRKTEGLLLPMAVRDNLSLAALSQLGRLGIVDRAAEDRAVTEMVRRLHIRLGDSTDAVGTLSGGNQQKVVIGKWLMTRPRLILLNDPTRGIDVGTKQELYALMRELADAGAAILFYSTDYDELVGCCNRVLILYDGRIVRVLEGDEITEHAIVASALNITTPVAEAA
ncbi:MAG TPA: sugar ABC transporter ATP-binding protein [Geminicoccaceae bacterium]|nr:sugar ABC transporter ATP-binding protein [Geminicoccaceae bacterium]